MKINLRHYYFTIRMSFKYFLLSLFHKITLIGIYDNKETEIFKGENIVYGTFPLKSFPDKIVRKGKWYKVGILSTDIKLGKILKDYKKLTF